MRIFFSILIYIGSVASAYYMLNAIMSTNYIAQAGSALMAIAFVLIPYCLLATTSPDKEE